MLVLPVHANCTDSSKDEWIDLAISAVKSNGHIITWAVTARIHHTEKKQLLCLAGASATNHVKCYVP